MAKSKRMAKRMPKKNVSRRKLAAPEPQSFKDEAHERAFWESPSRDSSVYLDWAQARRAVFPNLKPTTQTISLRLPRPLLDSIKAAANARDVPYQSLIKVWLQERLDRP